MTIKSKEQFIKYISIIELNVKIYKCKDIQETMDEDDKNPFVIITDQIYQIKKMPFIDRMELLELIVEKIMKVYSEEEGFKLINQLTENYISSEGLTIEIKTNWEEIMEFVKKFKLFNESFINAISAFERKNRPNSCLSIEISSQIENKELKELCIKNSIKFADRTVFNYISKNFLKDPIFNDLIVPFIKERFVDFKKSFDPANLKPLTKNKKEYDEIIEFIGPMIYCVYNDKTHMDFVFEEFPDAHPLIQNFFLNNWPKIFLNSITDKSLLFKYFKKIIDILEKETELKVQEDTEESKNEDEVKTQR